MGRALSISLNNSKRKDLGRIAEAELVAKKQHLAFFIERVVRRRRIASKSTEK